MSITKQDVVSVIQKWPVETTKEVANEIHKPCATVSYILKKLKEAGIPIKKKNQPKSVSQIISEIIYQQTNE